MLGSAKLCVHHKQTATELTVLLNISFNYIIILYNILRPNGFNLETCDIMYAEGIKSILYNSEHMCYTGSCGTIVYIAAVFLRANRLNDDVYKSILMTITFQLLQ